MFCSISGSLAYFFSQCSSTLKNVIDQVINTYFIYDFSKVQTLEHISKVFFWAGRSFSCMRTVRQFRAFFASGGGGVYMALPSVLYTVALPVLRLPQTRKAAPNGAACYPFGAAIHAMINTMQGIDFMKTTIQFILFLRRVAKKVETSTN